VHYVDAPPKIDMSMESSLENVESKLFWTKPFNPNKSFDLEEIEVLMLTTKTVDWSYEREWRIVKHRGPWSIIDPMNPNGGLSFQLNQGCITAVYLGVAMTQQQRKMVVQQIKKSSSVQVFQMQWIKNGFNLVPQAVPWADGFKS
jgi:hypothetical protein